MALNPFFLQGSQGEQRLVQDLINEHLRIYGVEVTYIPRKFVARETIMEEVTSSKFCLLYTSPSPRDGLLSRMPSSA